MNQDEMGKIALAIMMYRIENEGIHQLNNKSVKQSMEEASKATGIPEKKLMEFFHIITTKAVDKCFASE